MKQMMTFVALLLTVAPAASAFDYVGGFKDWAVYKDSVNGEPVCYATTRATDKAPKAADHGDVVFFVTYFRGNRLPQNSVRVNYKFREDLPAKAVVSNRSWKLYSVANEIFANNNDETAIADALRKGSELKVEAMSERNTEVAYHFSLSGSSGAIDKAKALCG